MHEKKIVHVLMVQRRNWSFLDSWCTKWILNQIL